MRFLRRSRFSPELPRFERDEHVSFEVSSLSLTTHEIRVPMHEQRYVPIENAASDRTVYPEHPSLALAAAIEHRRAQLVSEPKRTGSAGASDISHTGPEVLG